MKVCGKEILSIGRLPSHSQTCFSNEHDVPRNGGIRGLVARSFTQDNNNDQFADEDESVFQMAMTDFTSRLEGKLLDDFVKIMNMTPNMDVSGGKTRIPTTTREMHKFYLTGKTSTLSNIPSPNCFLWKNHARTSLVSVVEHFMAHGINHSGFVVGNEPNANMLNKTPVVKEMMNDMSNEAHDGGIVLLLSFLCDDFEVNNVKQGRHSTWLFIVTISPLIKLQTSFK